MTDYMPWVGDSMGVLSKTPESQRNRMPPGLKGKCYIVNRDLRSDLWEQMSTDQRRCIPTYFLWRIQSNWREEISCTKSLTFLAFFSVYLSSISTARITPQFLYIDKFYDKRFTKVKWRFIRGEAFQERT